jgi:hypothetical protein
MSRASPTKSRALHKSKRNKKWKRHPQDWYVEPSWSTNMLFAAEKFEGRVWDPAAGIGPHPDAGTSCRARGRGERHRGPRLRRSRRNFLRAGRAQAPNIVCNPPFKIAREFVKRALELADARLRSCCLPPGCTGQTRSRWLASTPLRRVYFLAPRPSMPPGPVVMAGHEPSNGLSDFAWFVWHKGYDGAPEIRWLRRDDSVHAESRAESARPRQFPAPSRRSGTRSKPAASSSHRRACRCSPRLSMAEPAPTSSPSGSQAERLTLDSIIGRKTASAMHIDFTRKRIRLGVRAGRPAAAADLAP